jgi:hypothetical protein
MSSTGIVENLNPISEGPTEAQSDIAHHRYQRAH